jgi:hypothetical protein
MSKRTRKSSKPVKAKSYVLLGTDEYAKPRAAKFSAEADRDLLAKAAAALHLWLIEVTDEELAELESPLPAGRLHASGGGLVPYIKGELYLDLLWTALADDPSAEEDQAPTAQDLPRTWDEIAPGQIVIARESFECGWWEAVVIERHGDLLTLKHRDYPSMPNFVRHRSAVALISAPAP